MPVISWLYIYFRFIEKVQQETPGHGVKGQLQILCNIYALSVLHKHLGDFLATGCITSKQASLANDQLRSLYAQVSLIILQKLSELFLEFFLEKHIKY